MNGCAEHLEACQHDSRRLRGRRKAARIEHIEAARAAEAQAAVLHPKVCTRVKFLALQAVLAMVGLDCVRDRIKAHQPGISAQPQLACAIAHAHLSGTRARIAASLA